MDTNSKIYLESNILLAKTLNIKSEQTAESVNSYVKHIDKLITIGDDKTTWKYYKNISGEYHEIDTLMKIISLDTLEEIDFTKENLSIHKTTHEAYNYGTRYYYSLVNLYPKQENLILGILYPTDKTFAIEAENGTILSYPSYLIEEQEVTLIYELQEYIKNYLVRWSIPAFSLSDTLYNAAEHAIMYLNILPKLLNLRLKRCKTFEAHSFHIKEYLSSHGKLDKYMPYMKLKQILYLYRNILYLERNSGKSKQLEELIDVFLTSYNIPIDELSVRHINEFDNKYYPEITVRRKAINSQYNTSEKDYFDLDNLFNKTKFLNTGNELYLNKYKKVIEKQLKNSNSSITQTKNLDSNMIDYTNAVPDPLNDVLLRQWVSMASKGHYNAIITFKDTKYFNDYSLKAIDAFIYMYYIILKSSGINIETIPNFANIKQRKLELPTKEEMLSVVSNNISGLSELADEIINNQPEITNTVSVNSFYELAYSIYIQAQNHWFTISNIGDINKRAMLSNMIECLYEDELIILPDDGMSFSTWLLNKNLPEYNYNQIEAKELIEEIFNKATGLYLQQNTKLANIQSAMINIVKQLSSYSIQFIYNVNEANLKILNWAAIRIGTIEYNINNEIFLPENHSVIDGTAEVFNTINAEETLTEENKAIVTNDYNYNLEEEFDMDSKIQGNYYFDLYEPSYFIDVTNNFTVTIPGTTNSINIKYDIAANPIIKTSDISYDISADPTINSLDISWDIF